MTATALHRPPPVRSPGRLPEVIDAVLVRVGEPPGTGHLTRLRYKPDGSVVAGYVVGPARLRVCLTIAAGSDPARGSIGSAPIVGRWPGVVELTEVGVRIEAFPHDAGLPALARLVADPALVLPDPQVDSAVEVVRHKPGSRAVLRLSSGGRVLFVKLYRHRDQAERAWYLAERLHHEGVLEPHLPVPDRFVPEVAAVVTEAVEPAVPGSVVFRPGGPARGRALLDAPVPSCHLHAAGAALARLHAVPRQILADAGGVARSDSPSRPRDLGARLAGWGEEIAALSPIYAERACHAVGRTGEALAAGGAGEHRIGHGAYKPSQVLVDEHRLVMTDLDDVGQADPARDLGNFLGYLRPDALWRRVDGARRWFDAAADALTRGYRDASLAAGRPPAEVAQALAGTGPYAAAALLKRTARRAHRANAPRDLEVGAVLAELDRLLDDPCSVP